MKKGRESVFDRERRKREMGSSLRYQSSQFLFQFVTLAEDCRLSNLQSKTNSPSDVSCKR